MAKQEFATQIDPSLLEQLRSIARDEGRQLQAIVEEALIDLLEKKRGLKPRPHVMAQYEASVARFHCVYEHLAK